jgi:hypothetical protein
MTRITIEPPRRLRHSRPEVRGEHPSDRSAIHADPLAGDPTSFAARDERDHVRDLLDLPEWVECRDPLETGQDPERSPCR